MSNQKKQSTEAAVREIRRRSRRKFSPEETIRIVLEGLRGERSVVDSCRREGIAWRLSPTMGATDLTETLDEAIAITGVDQVKVKHRPRLLSDNGPAYLSGELREYLGERKMAHTRGAPYHAQTLGKIERYHRTMKNVVKLQHDYFPEELKMVLKDFIAYYNNERYHESLSNITPADVYVGRQYEVFTE